MPVDSSQQTVVNSATDHEPEAVEPMLDADMDAAIEHILDTTNVSVPDTDAIGALLDDVEPEANDSSPETAPSRLDNYAKTVSVSCQSVVLIFFPIYS